MIRLLVNSNEFWNELKKDVLLAKQSIYIQTLSFEGDVVGKKLSKLLLLSKAIDKMIIIDEYSKWFMSDRFIFSPLNLLDFELQYEVQETYQMIDMLRQHGVRVKFVNPVGMMMLRFPARNHKKIIVIDGTITYLGGINFSEHNFGWHDSMIRIEEPEIADVFCEDFLTTWKGWNNKKSAGFSGMEIHILDGSSNEEMFDKIIAIIKNAKRNIFIESPYITFPIVDILRDKRREGIQVTLVTPDSNNRKMLKEYIVWESTQSHFNIRLYRGMSHLKAILIDDCYLITGSSNFDYFSYSLNQEVVAIVSDPTLISDFKQRILKRDIDESHEKIRGVNYWRGLILSCILRFIGMILVQLNRRVV